MMLQIIGAGFGRTGTHSLGLALGKLGYGPCYNVHQVAKNPDHRDLWNQAMKGKKIDWDHLFRMSHSQDRMKGKILSIPPRNGPRRSKRTKSKRHLTLPALDRTTHTDKQRVLQAFGLVKAAVEAKTHVK